MRSGQSRLSSGSHVLSSLRKREYLLNHLTDLNTIFSIREGLNHQPKTIYLLANHLFSQRSLYKDKMTNMFFFGIKLNLTRMRLISMHYNLADISFLLREALPLEKEIHSALHHPSVQNLLHHIFFLFLLYHLTRLLLGLLLPSCGRQLAVCGERGKGSVFSREKSNFSVFKKLQQMKRTLWGWAEQTQTETLH